VRFSVLALDYDGTIAIDGALDPEVRRAIADVRRLGITVVIVTGRRLNDLRDRVGDLRLVDAIVAENGAVIAFPATGRTSDLASPAPAALVDHLRRHGIDIAVGASIVEADAGAAGAVLGAIRALQLPHVMVFNRGRLMVLPSGINKTSGLREVLRTLRLSTHNAIAIGDAENDHDLLYACELGIAVGWGSAALKAAADDVLEGAGPAAVAGAIRTLATNVRIAPERVGRRKVLLGVDRSGARQSLAVRGRNVLIAGDPKSGKSWVAGLLCEQHILHRYSTCVIDPEGDYVGLEAMPGVVVLGGNAAGPSPHELRTALRYPDVNLVINLSLMPHAEKWSYIRTLLPTLADVRRRTGAPHRIVLDEAHYFLHEPDVKALLDLDLGGYTLVTYEPSRLHADVLAATEAVIVTRMTDARELELLAAGGQWAPPCTAAIAALELGQAALISSEAAECGFVAPVILAPRLTAHVRHREKYADVPVPAERAFVFTAADDGEQRATTFREFIRLLAARPAAEVAGYVERGDFSRWVNDVFGDPALSAALRTIEDQFRLGRIADPSDAVIHAIASRYQLAA